ncbi:MAG: hypothetical protein WD078_04185 [Woeseia sp.]
MITCTSRADNSRPTRPEPEFTGPRSLLWLLLWTAVLYGAIAAAPPAAAQAQEDLPPASFDPYVMVGLTHDSNPLRVSSAAEIRGSDDESDLITTLEAGLDSYMAVSRQTLILKGRVFRNQYEEFDQIDHTGGNALGEWQWVWGSAWSGDLGYLFTRQLRDLANQSNAAKDMREESRFFGSVERGIGAGLRAVLAASSADIEFEENERLSLTRDTGQIGIYYESALDRSVGLEGKFTDGQYELDSDRDYDETSLQAVFDWPFSEKTRLAAKAGFTSRDFDVEERPDFSGVTGLVSLVRTNAKGGLLTVSIYREPSTLGDEIANYAIVEGITIAPEWPLGIAINLRLDLNYERRDFRGVRDLTISDPDLESREDDVVSGALWLDWDVSRIFRISFGLAAGERSSTLPAEEYDFQRAQIQFRAGF